MSRSYSFNLVLVFFFLKNIKKLQKAHFELFEKARLKRASLNELSF